MNESSVEVITQEELDHNIRDICLAAEKYCSLYSRGLLAEEDRRFRIIDALNDGLWGFLRNKHLSLRIAAGDWPAFLNAVRAWRKDGDVRRLQVCSWLFFDRTDRDRNICCGDEASVHDKIRILTLLDACHVPIEYFRPVPDGIACPDYHPGHFPNEIIIGYEIWEQDSGLAQGNYRIGETKTLIDHHGLKTVIQISLYTPESEQNRFHESDFEGTGTVEGYTSSRPRQIKVYLNRKKGKISFLKFLVENDDCLNFPLWQEYLEDRAGIHKLYEKIIEDLIADYT